ncbi:hypothetical protein HN51_055185 [Arachis hypogaea]
MFESYRRIKLFLSKKEGDFIHDLEQSFFALVNASRDPNVPFFSSSEYNVFSYLSNSVLLASAFAGIMAILATATNVEILMNILGINLVGLVALAVCQWYISVWQYNEKSGHQAWKGLSWGMVPLLGGALCACT